jgi:hypothetical protein
MANKVFTLMWVYALMVVTMPVSMTISMRVAVIMCVLEVVFIAPKLDIEVEVLF